MLALVLIAILPAMLAAQEPREIVRRSIELDRRNTEMSRRYNLLYRQEDQELDEAGKVRSRDVRTWAITMLEGSPYRRLVARDDRPLPPKEQQLEEQKLRRSMEERRKETPEQRARRIADWERGQQKRREPLEELPDAFDFKLAGGETLNGSEAWVI